MKLPSPLTIVVAGILFAGIGVSFYFLHVPVLSGLFVFGGGIVVGIGFMAGRLSPEI